MQLEPVDLSLKTPVVLQVPKYPPQRLRNPIPQGKATVTPPLGKWQYRKELEFEGMIVTSVSSRTGQVGRSARTHTSIILKELILSRR